MASIPEVKVDSPPCTDCVNSGCKAVAPSVSENFSCPVCYAGFCDWCRIYDPGDADIIACPHCKAKLALPARSQNDIPTDPGIRRRGRITLPLP